MASYDRISFSLESFKEMMNNLIDDSLNEAVAEIQKNEWFTGTIPTGLSKANYDKYIEITANHLKAWIIEYGQGEAAEYERNPYWRDYVESSGLTHRKRLSNPQVLKRGSSNSYKSIDFYHGKIVEYDHGSDPEGDPVNDSLQKAFSVKAKPFLGDLMESAWQAFLSVFNTKLQSFNYNGCYLFTKEII